LTRVKINHVPTELSAETRARVLDAAWQRVLERGSAGVSVKDIAAAAGVSRQLVYFHYGSRAGLLTAMARRRDEASGFARALAAGADLEGLLRAWCDYLPEILPVARALEAALVTGDEGGAAWRDRMAELHAVFARAVRHIELADGWTPDAAADWIWARVQPSAYAHLVGERGWTHAEFAERVVASLLGELTDHLPRGAAGPEHR
jgi:AcrR family transcriptional regulator